MAREYPYVPDELPEKVKTAFSVNYIINRDDLNSDQKIACIRIIDEVCNYLQTSIDENRR